MQREWAAERKRFEQLDRESGEDEYRAARGDEAADRDQGHRDDGERDAPCSFVRDHHA